MKNYVLSIKSNSKSVFFAVLSAIALLVVGCIKQNDSAHFFEDVTLSSGLENHKGMTHGVAWGDFDRDGLADIYVSNHLLPAQLFRNLGNGRFEDVSIRYFKPKDLGGDKHGAVWADFNNDGHPDLVQLTGAGRGVGAEPKRLFVNRSEHFEDMAEDLGVSNKFGRTRMPLAVDLDNNGFLDVFHGAEVRFDKRVPPYIFMQQNNGSFVADRDLIQFKGKSVPFCIVSELNNDSHSDLVCRVVGKHRTAQTFDLSASPAADLDLLPVTAFEDIASGDFDNDGAVDLFLARKNPSGQIAFGRPGSNIFIADVKFNPSNYNKKTGFEFFSTGNIDLHIKSTFPSGLLTANKIHLGKTDRHPDSMTFSLSKETAGILGTAPYQPGSEAGVYIGFTPPDKWQVLVSGAQFSAGKGKYQQLTFRISTSEPITNLSALNKAEKTEEAPFRLFMNRDGKLVEESNKRGVNNNIVAAVNVTAGDFDNDMDLDLFVLASGDIGKQENVLLLNNGNGNFTAVAGTGGAAGNHAGVGDSVTTVDFDNDGFLDLLTATGGSMGRSLGLPSNAGEYHLYHNIGNSNHWLELDLKGTESNRDGIGAIVKVSVGGVTQTRVQDGGVHHRSQNHQRLHFGLARNTMIDKILIQWPSGKVQELNNIQADQIMQIVEP